MPGDHVPAEIAGFDGTGLDAADVAAEELLDVPVPALDEEGSVHSCHHVRVHPAESLVLAAVVLVLVLGMGAGAGAGAPGKDSCDS